MDVRLALLNQNKLREQRSERSAFTHIHLFDEAPLRLKYAFDVLGEVVRVGDGQLAAVGAELFLGLEIDAVRIDLDVQMTNETIDEVLTERFEVLLGYAIPGLLFDPVREQVANYEGQVAAAVVAAQVLKELRFGFDLAPAAHLDSGFGGRVVGVLDSFLISFRPVELVDSERCGTGRLILIVNATWTISRRETCLAGANR